MQLTMFELDAVRTSASSSGKTSPAYSAPKTTRSGAFWLGLPEKMGHWSRQGKLQSRDNPGSGRTLVLCMDPGAQSLGGPWTPNISEWPNDAAVCSLSQVLEKDSIPPRFFLNGTACAGILRRAEKRGKQLPPSLHAALAAVALERTSTVTAG